MVYPFLSVGNAAVDAYRMHRDFPMIGSFEEKNEMARWEAKNGGITRGTSFPTHGNFSMGIHLNPGTYPGISTRNLVHDWRDYSVLSFEIYVTGGKPLKITVRIDDETHNETFEDRYNGKFVLHPGLNEITIPLKVILHAPKGREMDPQAINFFCIFSYNLKKKQTLYIDNIKLSR